MEPRSVNATPSNGEQALRPSDINGRKLARALKTGTIPADWQARLALRLQEGAVFLHHLTAKQARQVTGAKCADLAAERRKHRQANGDGKRRVLYRGKVSDSDIDAVVAKLGPDKVMAALDRLTKPRCNATTEMFSAAQ
jgi:hypothetical protein